MKQKTEGFPTVGDLIKGLGKYSPDTIVNIFDSSVDEGYWIDDLVDQYTDPPQVDISINQGVDYVDELTESKNILEEINKSLLDWDNSSKSNADCPDFEMSVKTLHYNIWKKIESVGSPVVHCLKCDDVFKEKDPPIQVCPKCGNDDMESTVYLQDDL